MIARRPEYYILKLEVKKWTDVELLFIWEVYYI
jgi:hypothetical protein